MPRTNCRDFLGIQGSGRHLPMRGCRFDPWLGAEIPRASWPRNQNIDQKRYCDKLTQRLLKWSMWKTTTESQKTNRGACGRAGRRGPSGRWGSNVTALWAKREAWGTLGDQVTGEDSGVVAERCTGRVTSCPSYFILFGVYSVSCVQQSDSVVHMCTCVCLHVCMTESQKHAHMHVVAHAVAQLCPTLQPMDCSPPGSSVRGISQARLLEWVAACSTRGSSRPRDRTCLSCGFCTGS